MEIKREQSQPSSLIHVIATIVIVGVLVGVTAGVWLRYVFGLEGPTLAAPTASITAATTSSNAIVRSRA
jgi:hypothetical protein